MLTELQEAQNKPNLNRANSTVQMAGKKRGKYPLPIGAVPSMTKEKATNKRKAKAASKNTNKASTADVTPLST